MVKAIQGFNDTASAITVTMAFTDASASTSYDVGYVSSSTVEQFSLLTDDLLVLEESDVLKLTSSAANQITGVASILEQDRT